MQQLKNMHNPRILDNNWYISFSERKEFMVAKQYMNVLILYLILYIIYYSSSKPLGTNISIMWEDI